jgi:hypothetical protein
VWKQVGTTCTCKGACVCEQMESLSLSEALTTGSPPGLQHAMSQGLADRCHEQLLGKYQDMLNSAGTNAAAQQHLARLLSVQHSHSVAQHCAHKRRLGNR